MTTPVKNSGTTESHPTDNYPTYNDYPNYNDYDPENYGGGGSPSGDYVDNSDMQENLSVSELRQRIQGMENTIKNDPSLTASQKQKMLSDLTKLEGRINYAVCLDPQQQANELQSINQAIGNVESEAVQSPSLTDPQTPPTDQGGGDGNTIKDLQKKSSDIQTKLDALLSDGKISQEVYDNLNQKLSRMNTALDGVTEDDQDTKDTIQQTLSDISDTVALLNKQYLINGEKITELPEDAPVGQDKPDKKDLPDPLKKLLALMPGVSVDKLLEKLQEDFPDLDANSDGKITMQELKDGVANKAFPPSRPDDKLIKLLTDLDPDLKDKWDATTADFSNDNTGTQDPNQEFPRYRSLMQQLNQKLVTELDALYPGRVSMQDPNSTDYRLANNLVFVDDSGKKQVFEAFREDTVTRDIKVQWYGEA